MRDEISTMLLQRVSAIFGCTDLTEETRFAEDLKAKSIHYSQITTYLEDQLDIEIPYMPFRRNKTLGEAIDFVLSLCEE